MKGLKYITGCSLTLLLLAACNKEEGPSIDDYFLNYEIPEIPVTEDYQVGIFYNKNGDLAQTVSRTLPVGSFWRSSIAN